MKRVIWQVANHQWDGLRGSLVPENEALGRHKKKTFTGSCFDFKCGLIFITGNFQDDIGDGLSSDLFSLSNVSEQDLGLLRSLVHFFFSQQKAR